MVFFAAHRLSLVAESRGYCVVAIHGLLTEGAFLVATGSRAGGLQEWHHMGSVTPSQVESSQTRQLNSCLLDRQANSRSLNHQQSPALRRLTTVSDTASRRFGGVLGVSTMAEDSQTQIKDYQTDPWTAPYPTRTRPGTVNRAPWLHP